MCVALPPYPLCAVAAMAMPCKLSLPLYLVNRSTVTALLVPCCYATCRGISCTPAAATCSTALPPVVELQDEGAYENEHENLDYIEGQEDDFGEDDELGYDFADKGEDEYED
uniref:Uncharacterized protein n=1 Tax=Arundo donax TaxID=35708 RepID=A0A0A9D5F9_ARUDO